MNIEVEIIDPFHERHSNLMNYDPVAIKNGMYIS